MIYVFRSVASQGARDLAEALPINARKISAIQQPHYGQGLRSGDAVVCWGEALPERPGIRILNGAPMLSKFEAAVRLREAGVPTVEVSRTRPAPVAQPAPVDPAIAVRESAREAANDYVAIDLQNLRNPVHVTAVQEIISQFTNLQRSLLTPPPPAPSPQVVGEWLPRTNNHVGGTDLLRPTGITPNYFVKKENLTEEIRIHSFMDKSIKAGKKVPRTDFTGVRNPWIRSYDGGWGISYADFSSKRAQRELAHQAVAALGLQFGAVDLGKKADGTWIVLEVNRAPGADQGTTQSYAAAIAAWNNGQEVASS